MSLKSALFAPAAPLMVSAARAALRRDPTRTRLWHATNAYAAYRGFERTARTVSGARLRVRTDDFLQKHLYFFGEWEPLLTRYLLDRPPSDRAFVDVGANIGYLSLVAAARFASVHAVEASPSIARMLRANVAASTAGNVTVHECAVGAEEGEIAFYRGGEANIGTSSTTERAGARFEATVPVRPLPDILPAGTLERTAFVKIDVEGAEEQVVLGLLPAMGRLPRDAEVLLEVHPDEPGTLRALSRLRAEGFEARVMQHEYELAHYQDRDLRSPLEPLAGEPDRSCDLLLRRPA